MMVVIDPEKKIQLPFSRGILTRSITLAGVDVGTAYVIAHEVQMELIRRRKRFVSTEEIRELTYKKLLEHGLKKEAERYLFWREFKRKKIPLVVLLGGVTGVGKSTIATELAFRLSIRTIIGTDTVREVMRKIIAKELLPDLHASSFMAWRTLKGSGGIIEGFENQVRHVSVGVKAVLDRAQREGMNAIIEGIHLVPGFIEPGENTFMYVLAVSDRKVLESHFYERSRYSKRPAEYYIKHLDEILLLQDYIVEKAREHGVKVIENVELEKTVDEIMEDLMNRLREAL